MFITPRVQLVSGAAAPPGRPGKGSYSSGDALAGPFRPIVPVWNGVIHPNGSGIGHVSIAAPPGFCSGSECVYPGPKHTEDRRALDRLRGHAVSPWETVVKVQLIRMFGSIVRGTIQTWRKAFHGRPREGDSQPKLPQALMTNTPGPWL